MADQKIPGVQLQGDKGPRRLLPLRQNSVLMQFQQKKARSGFAYLPNGSKEPAFSEHPKYCRLYVDDALAVRAVLELAASKYGVPLIVKGDPELCKIITEAAHKMGIAVTSDEAQTNVSQLAPSIKSGIDKPVILHPIANETLVRFTSNNKTRPVLEGKVIASETLDGKSYRYRIAQNSDGTRIANVYSDDGVIEHITTQVEIANANGKAKESHVETIPVKLAPNKNHTLTNATTPAWMMTKNTYLDDKLRVRMDVGMDKLGYKVDYDYVMPGIVGPYSGALLSANKPNVDASIFAPFGDAIVKKVSASKQDIPDHGIILAGKLHHRRIVTDALMAGKHVPPEVLVDYPEIESRIKDWITQQINDGVPLPPEMYNGIQSVRGGVIHVTHDEPTGDYGVFHDIGDVKHEHVTGVDADGAREAVQKLLGMTITKVAPSVVSVKAVQVSSDVVNESGVMLARYNIEPLPAINLEGLFEEAVEAGETDILLAVQTSLDGLIQQVNQRISAVPYVQVDADPDKLNQQRMAAELSLRDWTDKLGFLGDNPTEISNKWRGVIAERDTLIDRVAELETQLRNFADKSDSYEDEMEQE